MLVAGAALAQSVTQPLDSVWAVWDTTAKHSVSATLLRKNATSGALEAIPGQRVSPGTLYFRATGIQASFPGQSTTPMTVAGVRLFHSATGEDWEIPEHPVNVRLRTPLEVPAGRTVACVYSSPLLMKGSIKCEVGLAMVNLVTTPSLAVRVVRNSTRANVVDFADGMVFVRSIFPAVSNLGVKADPLVAVSRIDFALDGVLINTEGGVPYMACGDWIACPQIFAVGNRTLVVTPYDAAGVALAPLTFRYTVK